LARGGDHLEHRVIIRRRGRAHRCSCSCGWTGRAWNELRPAEADAWEHVFGPDCIVDMDSVAKLEDRLEARRPAPELVAALVRTGSSPAAVDKLVRHARSVANRPSPYSHHACEEIWRIADHDPAAIQSAIAEVDELLARHSRRSASTADAEWLELITTKRLLADSLESDHPDD
jgi:hypothetical protein